MSKVNTRIRPIMAMFMIGVALIYDGAKAFINLITFGFLGWLINPFINIWAQMTFLFWFTFLGVSFLKKGKLKGTKIATMGVPSIIGLIPLVDSLPFWTSGVVTNIAVVYAEDMIESFAPETLQSMAKVTKKISKKKSQATKTTSLIETDAKTKKQKIEEIEPKTDKTSTPNKQSVEIKPEISKKKEEKPKAELEKFDNYAEDLARRKKRKPAYTEFARETGKMEPVEEEGSPDDWPIAI